MLICLGGQDVFIAAETLETSITYGSIMYSDICLKSLEESTKF